jgi:hypothetical protein
MRNKIIVICLLAVLLVSSGITASRAYADAILFPWIVKGDSVSTIISVVNTAGPWMDGFGLNLHYQYWYKASTTNGDTELCTEYDFMRPTSVNDIVSFDASGIVNDGKAIFNDASPYGDSGFKLSASSPRRAFLIVDNNTSSFVDSQSNGDGTLYGEALIIDINTGLIWGYTAYNARGAGYANSPAGQVYFNDGYDYQGEVIGGNESSRVVILPTSEYNTKFYVTPIGISGQRSGNINTRVSIVYPDSYGGFYGGIYENNEAPFDFTKYVNVTCTSALSLSDLITEAAYVMFSSLGGQGWSHIKTYVGTATVNTTSQATIGKLEWKSITHTVSADLTNSEGCAFCKEGCLSKCKKTDIWCQAICAKQCKSVCSPKIEFDTMSGNFNWIRSGDSLPLPLILY